MCTSDVLNCVLTASLKNENKAAPEASKDSKESSKGSDRPSATAVPAVPPGLGLEDVGLLPDGNI